MRSWPLPVPDRPLEPPVDPPREAAPRYGVSMPKAMRSILALRAGTGKRP
jgi:hypothetical protein